MFAVSHNPYAYAAASAPPAPAPRQLSNHGTSSAFSSSANADEDWTKVSDLAERRRIQNRIAQRNYRKKLKKRLEDLERRAGTSDEAQATGEKPAKTSKTSKRQHQHQHQQQIAAPQIQKQAAPALPEPIPQSQFTPPMQNDDEYLFPTAPYNERERSHTPPLFAYSAYPPPPEDILIPSYGASQPYRAVTTEAYPDYLASTVPVTLPSMTHFSNAIKCVSSNYATEDSLSPYINYGGYVTGIDMSAGGSLPFDNSNPQTPPLSHSFDHSADCSDSGSHGYPTTPLSMPPSPGMTQRQM